MARKGSLAGYTTTVLNKMVGNILEPTKIQEWNSMNVEIRRWTITQLQGQSKRAWIILQGVKRTCLEEGCRANKLKESPIILDLIQEGVTMVLGNIEQKLGVQWWYFYFCRNLWWIVAD
eukprot:TRINITY_DN57529_c2_g1_i1.p2 TRINITY_DN57529_c2_g1~~TRINITY_DN57529_c2_g1_i1.p2  ORF type:complete len:119 (+),score=5.48 TRINITY_DN57529_c2_g1_i1:123-479(+)